MKRQNKEQKHIKMQSKHFEIKENQLYKKDKRQQWHLLKVLQKHELEPILFLIHNHPTGGHFRTDIMFNKIRDIYYWTQMYEDICQYIKTCDSCQRRGKKRTKEPLHSLSIERPFQRIGIDIVGPLPITERQNRYIVVATDYLTKWPEAKALSEVSAISVAHFIYEEIICRYDYLEIILSDWDIHFRNQLVNNLLENLKYDIIYLLLIIHKLMD